MEVYIYYHVNQYQDANTCRLYYASDILKIIRDGVVVINAVNGEIVTEELIEEITERS